MDPEAFLIDLDGVLHTGGSLIPGAADALRYLKDHGYQFRVLSNTTRRSRKGLASQLSAMGLAIPLSHIFTPARAAAAFIAGKGGDGAFILATPEVVEEFGDEGISAVTQGSGFVVVGDAGDLHTYGSLNQAFREIIGGAALIALEKDRYWLGSRGMMLSAGPFVAALEYASGRKATVVGKPSGEFFMLALASMGARPERSIMVGDDPATDIGGAISHGLTGILVRTGKFGKYPEGDGSLPPARVIPSIADLPALIESGELCPP